MARFMLALVDDRGFLLNEPMVPIAVCDLCGVLVLEDSVVYREHAHEVEETE